MTERCPECKSDDIRGIHPYLIVNRICNKCGCKFVGGEFLEYKGLSLPIERGNEEAKGAMRGSKSRPCDNSTIDE